MDVLPLIGIALIAGIVTAISPCVLPMLPVILAGTATGSRLRPYVVVAGLVVSFTAFTLVATLFLGALGLPADLLRNLAIGAVFVLAAVLLVGRVAETAGRPFHVLARRRTTDLGGGLLLGMSMGLLFIPCAGPIVAAIAVVAATRDFSAEAVFITLAYAVGAGLALLAIALAARRGLNLAGTKARASGIRRGLGVVVLATGVIMILGLDARLASNVPGYTRALQGLEQSAAAQDRIARVLTGPAEIENRTVFDAGRFSDFGPTPDFRDIALWLNSEPLSLGELRDKVVLVDFWTYSCVNCLRTLPHLKRWDEAYRDSGLVIVGVHSPEFAFEREAANVRDAVADLDIEYSVALDNGFSTWKAWDNRFWPTKYIIDKRGHLRFSTSERVPTRTART